MKFVLAGSREKYQSFVDNLWSKDKPISDYRYIHRIDTILGAGTGNELIILANATEHPNYEYLLKECEARGIHRRSARSRIGHGRSPSYPGFQSEGIQYLGTRPEPMRVQEVSLSIIDESDNGAGNLVYNRDTVRWGHSIERWQNETRHAIDENFAREAERAAGGITIEMIEDTMERMRRQPPEPTFTVPETGLYSVTGEVRIYDEGERIQEAQATEADSSSND